jgi:hypothetical protein
MKLEYFVVKSCISRCLNHIGKLGESPDEWDYQNCIDEIRYQLSFLGDWVDIRKGEQ